MGMPASIELLDENFKAEKIEEVFFYFNKIDKKFSLYKKNSEINLINRGEIDIKKCSLEMKHILHLSEQTKKETNGYFDINLNGKLDPSGIVKGYAIWMGANILSSAGYKNFYLEIAGDIELRGDKLWKIGIENPFARKKIIKVLKLKNCGIATSGNYIRGNHIYDPVNKKNLNEIVSFSVIGKNVYEADRFATAAFAMGLNGINFIENLEGFEGYMVKNNGIAIFTSGLNKFI